MIQTGRANRHAGGSGGGLRNGAGSGGEPWAGWVMSCRENHETTYYIIFANRMRQQVHENNFKLRVYWITSCFGLLQLSSTLSSTSVIQHIIQPLPPFTPIFRRMVIQHPNSRTQSRLTLSCYTLVKNVIFWSIFFLIFPKFPVFFSNCWNFRWNWLWISINSSRPRPKNLARTQSTRQELSNNFFWSDSATETLWKADTK